jgi:glycogen debranching enzyme
MLRALAQHQRVDGLIMEHIDGCSGGTEDHGFNINDNTPLFVMAVEHHIQVTGHTDCLHDLYDSACQAGEAILRARNDQGLVTCLAAGIGIKGICGWRNVMQHERITGAVTEVNAECYAALRALSRLARIHGDEDAAQRFEQEAEPLRCAINTHLKDPSTGLYVRNIDPDGRVFSQATIDLVFPLICDVADASTARLITTRLAMPDFMSAGGIRALPEENPRYDPSFEAGLLGGVWPGATWWYALGSARTDPRIMVESLRRSYWHYVTDPRVYNTVPGQFSEWMDGQTLVNRGMRLSPWEAPRFLWATIEGAVGLQATGSGATLDPHLPPEWRWLRVHHLPYRDQCLSFFLARQDDEMHLYTCDRIGGTIARHGYAEELPHGVETITTGVSLTAFRRDGEVLICVGNSLETPTLGPFLAHHALKSGTRYRVQRLTGGEPTWREMGTLAGDELQRVTIQLEARGYALYRFEAID